MKSALFAVSLITVLALVGCAGTGGEETTTAETPEAPEGPARYEIAVGTTGFEPATVHARAGEPVTLVFTRTTEETCGTEVVVPSQDMEVPLPLDEPVEITLVPAEEGVIEYSCGMEMLMGKVVVGS